MPKQYDNLLNDLFASTGLNLGASFGSHTDLYRRSIGTLTNYALNGNNDFTFEGKYSKNIGINNNPFINAAEGLRNKAGLFASRKYELGRRQQSTEMYESFLDENNEFSRTVDMLSAASSRENENFAMLEGDLMEAKRNMGQGSTASSVGAYQVAAKREMQETGRVLAMLNSVKAPEQQTFDPTFINPLTGEKMTQSDEFTFEGEDVRSAVESMVRGDFKRRVGEISSEIDAGVKEEYGYSYSEYFDMLEKVQPMYDKHKELYPNTGAYHYDYMSEAGMTLGQFEQLKEMQGAYEQLGNFAESRALAEMADVTEGYTASRQEGRGMANVYSTGSQVFLEADREAILQDIITTTGDLYETQEGKDIKALTEEFNRRKTASADLAADAERRNKLNAMRAEDLERQKIDMAQRLTAQQNDYASTLASRGAVETATGGIRFTDIRPA